MVLEIGELQIDEIIEILHMKNIADLVALAAETVYIYDSQHIISLLLDVPPPTHYPFSLHHLNRNYAEPLGIDPAKEVARILAQTPRFVIADSVPQQAKFGDASLELATSLARSYRLVRRYTEGDTVVLWIYEHRE